MKRIILVSIIVGIICCKSVYANEFESNTYITLDDFDLKETQNVIAGYFLYSQYISQNNKLISFFPTFV